MTSRRLPLPATSPDLGLLILRVAIAVVLLFHGVSKLNNGIAWMAGPLGAFGLPGFVGYGAYVAELVAPVLLIVGVWSRPAALVIAFDMMMAVALVLRSQVLAVKEAGGGWGIELEALICLGALALFMTGSGKYAARPD
jgi:putative oxidoreductase